MRLKSDWRARLASLFRATRPHLTESGALRGFFIGDELTAQGLPLDELELVVNALSAVLRSDGSIPASCRVLYYNDSIFVAAWGNHSIPHNLTHFSMDYYHGIETGRVGETVWDLYQKFVFPKLGSSTKVLFVPQCFGSKVDTRPGYTLTQYEDWSLGNLTQYIAWSARDPRIVGFNPWHLLNRGIRNVSSCDSSGFGCTEVGAASMPRLRKALAVLGAQVKRNAHTPILDT